MGYVGLIVTFTNGHQREYGIGDTGDWNFEKCPDRLVIRINGPGLPRYEIPTMNIQDIFVVDRPAPPPAGSSPSSSSSSLASSS